MEVSNVDDRTDPDKSRGKNRLNWKSRCSEMRGLRWNKKKASNETNDGSRPYYVVEDLTNLVFERYYKDQKICKDDEDWNRFMEYNHKLLPVSFRFNTSTPLWMWSLRKLLSNITNYDELSIRPCINYHPEYVKLKVDLFYQMDTDRSSLRKNEKYIELSKFLIGEDNRGVLTRQETVSMLPVLFLDPEPHENILDLCAAPGMKLLQIIDVVESKLQLLHNLDSTKNKGIIIGNDISQSRVSTLTHRIKSINSTSVAVTNFDASRFPSLYEKNGNNILFDRILADMPCSCDGTLRKSVDVWKTWQPLNGLHLHKVQLAILKRAIHLLKPGGLLIYSTCSLNPLENEAIASYVVSNSEELGVNIYPLKKINGISYETGLCDWFVPNPNGGYYTSYDQVDPSLHSRIIPSMFKSAKWDSNSASMVMRILPHYNNTGGFFIFSLKKNGNDVKPNAADEDDNVVEGDRSNVSKSRRINASKLLHEYEPWLESSDEYKRVCDFYGIDEDSDLIKQAIVKRTTDTNVFVTSKSPIVCNGLKRKNKGPYKYELVKYSIAGVRIFTRLESKATLNCPCDFRITQEGCAVLYGYMKRRMLFAGSSFGKLLLEKGKIASDELYEAERTDKVENLESCRLNGKLISGGCIVIIKLDNPEHDQDKLIVTCLITESGQLCTYIQKEMLDSINKILY